MKKKKMYQIPRISTYGVEPQVLLAGSDKYANPGGFKADDPVTYGDDDDVWEEEK